MQATTPEGMFSRFDWGELAAGSIIVDVGCGNGHISLPIARKYPALRFINQDLEQQIEQAKMYWETNLPSHVQNKLVEFQVHDFFDPEPVKDANVFLLRHIAHNWADDRLVKILQNLRDAAQPDKKLVLLDKILPVAATEGSYAAANDIFGAKKAVAPAPLLPNWGIGMAEFYYYDIGVYLMLGGVERTLGGFVDVLQKGNWRPGRVYHCPDSHQSPLVTVPV
ncbi:S-adenosyl-L-methionine-dependent methyltransferase [Mycena amicta]|nr:S-adenosyl-L-methionine-dependent methyltransferase [Mycena amicta]